MWGIPVLKTLPYKIQTQKCAKWQNILELKHGGESQTCKYEIYILTSPLSWAIKIQYVKLGFIELTSGHVQK